MADPPRTASGLDLTAATDESLLDGVLADRAAGRPAGASAGELLSRWRKPALYVIRRIQQSYRAGTAEDALELYQDAAFKFLDRGLDQFRGVRDEAGQGAAGAGAVAAARVFFLRIVKHTSIDHYRRHREELAPRVDDPDAALETSAPEIAVAEDRARASLAREEAADVYWKAFGRLRAEHPGEAEAWEAYHHLDLDDHEACARRLGISVASSYKRISRAQARLRLYLLELSVEGSSAS